MDAITGLLDGPRARRAFLLRSSMDPPWSLRVQDEAPLTLLAVVRGTAWLVPDGDPPVALAGGGVALLRGPDPYVVADDPGTAPQAVIHPGQRCTAPDGRPLEIMRRHGVRTWGNAADGGAVLVTGTYPSAGEVGTALLRALPARAVVEGMAGSPLVALLAEEAGRDRPGQEAVLDRLLDLLLVQALRTWFDRPGGDPPAWWRAHRDPVVGPAVRLIEDAPERPWTVASLAAEVGVSRAAFARRFTRLVGEPPMAFLAGRRIALAADLLCEPGATVASVAPRVGYGGPFALSAAFTRLRGESPRAHRERALAGAQ